MELARRVGLPMVGVNLPAHFMIRPVVEEMEVLVDCFKEGEIVFVEDVEEMLKKHYTMAEGETLTIDRSFFQDSVRGKKRERERAGEREGRMSNSIQCTTRSRRRRRRRRRRFERMTIKKSSVHDDDHLRRNQRKRNTRTNKQTT